MTPFFIAITITDVLLLVLLVSARLAWWVKLAAIAIVLSLNFLVWGALGSGEGWPVGQPIPDTAQFVACEIIEPDIAAQVEGTIYVWEIPLTVSHGLIAYRPEVGEPRAYREPYSRSLHEACQVAKQATGHGMQVGIRRSKSAGHHGRRGPQGKYVAYVLPSIKLPRKGR